MRKQAWAAPVLLLALLRGAGVHAAVPGTFQQVGDMTTPRVNPTATRLNDGTVLVTGGWKQIVATTHLVSQVTAERFDPQTNTFSPVGSMAFPRADHTAVRLQDGRVLVVGGSSDDFPNGGSQVDSKWVAAAEIYDPSTGKFSTVGDLTTPRVKAAAALLPNGKVLVMGGLALTKPMSCSRPNCSTRPPASSLRQDR